MRMSDGIIILGAGGHAKVIADILLLRGESFIGFLDDNAVGTTLNYPILGKISDVVNYSEYCSFIIGIGNNETRRTIAGQYNVKWRTAVHPTAIVARDVNIAEGSVVMAGAVINPSASIGKHSIINTSAVVEHDNRIGSFVHIAVGAKLGGLVSVGDDSWVGIGSSVRECVNICAKCMIGAGAAVISDIVEPGTYVGVPAKKLK